MLGSERRALWILNPQLFCGTTFAGRITHTEEQVYHFACGVMRIMTKKTEHAVNFKADYIYIYNVNMKRTIMYIVAIN